MNFSGLILGAGAFLCIGIFHPLVIKAEYYFGVRSWWAFLIIGMAAAAGSLFVANTYLSIFLGIFAFSSFWSIGEVFKQRERVRKGWFPQKKQIERRTMNLDRILPANKEHLLLMQVLCWLGPGIKIVIAGIQALLQVQAATPDRVWWLCLAALAVTVNFSLMFNNFVKRYTTRILNFPERKKSLFAFFDLHGYILIFCMMSLGISLKFLPFVPLEFFAGFYPGLGIALSIAGCRFFVNWVQT